MSALPPKSRHFFRSLIESAISQEVTFPPVRHWLFRYSPLLMVLTGLKVELSAILYA